MPRRAAVRLVLAGIVALSGAALPSGLAGAGTWMPAGGGPHGSQAHAGHALALHVEGNRIVNAHGKHVRLLGFNNSGAEYACMQGWGIFDDDAPDHLSVPTSDIAAMADWHGADAVRIQLNEQCWLGIGGVKPQYGGPAYQHAIESYVRELTDKGFAVILDLHLSAPDDEASVNQEEMPDANSIPFWTQVARAFKSNRAVLFDLFNEPWPFDQSISDAAWACWRDGGCTLPSQNGDIDYRAVGMDRLIKAVRSTGARNIVLAGGLDYASSLGKWLRFKPHDRDHELAASLHVYSFGGCHSPSCYDAAPTKVARKVPLVVGELGADLDVSYAVVAAGCPSSYSVTTGFDHHFFHWANHHHVSWLAWTWNPWHDCMALVQDFGGHPTAPYGKRVRQALKAHDGGHRA